MCAAVESATQLLAGLGQRVLRAQPGLGPSDRAALLALEPRVRREAAAAVVGAQAGAWAGLLHRYYWHKLHQLSEAAQAEADGEGGDEAMGGELGGGSLLAPGWGRRLQDVAAHLRALGLEVGRRGGWWPAHAGCFFWGR